jgi:hypothetical protein
MAKSISVRRDGRTMIDRLKLAEQRNGYRAARAQNVVSPDLVEHAAPPSGVSIGLSHS